MTKLFKLPAVAALGILCCLCNAKPLQSEEKYGPAMLLENHPNGEESDSRFPFSDITFRAGNTPVKKQNQAQHPDLVQLLQEAQDYANAKFLQRLARQSPPRRYHDQATPLNDAHDPVVQKDNQTVPTQDLKLIHNISPIATDKEPENQTPVDSPLIWKRELSYATGHPSGKAVAYKGYEESEEEIHPHPHVESNRISSHRSEQKLPQALFDIRDPFNDAFKQIEISSSYNPHSGVVSSQPVSPPEDGLQDALNELQALVSAFRIQSHQLHQQTGVPLRVVHQAALRPHSSPFYQSDNKGALSGYYTQGAQGLPAYPIPQQGQISYGPTETVNTYLTKNSYASTENVYPEEIQSVSSHTEKAQSPYESSLPEQTTSPYGSSYTEKTQTQNPLVTVYPEQTQTSYEGSYSEKSQSPYEISVPVQTQSPYKGSHSETSQGPHDFSNLVLSQNPYEDSHSQTSQGPHDFSNLVLSQSPYEDLYPVQTQSSYDASYTEQPKNPYETVYPAQTQSPYEGSYSEKTPTPYEISVPVQTESPYEGSYSEKPQTPYEISYPIQTQSSYDSSNTEVTPSPYVSYPLPTQSPYESSYSEVAQNSYENVYPEQTQKSYEITETVYPKQTQNAYDTTENVYSVQAQTSSSKAKEVDQSQTTSYTNTVTPNILDSIYSEAQGPTKVITNTLTPNNYQKQPLKGPYSQYQVPQLQLQPMNPSYFAQNPIQYYTSLNKGKTGVYTPTGRAGIDSSTPLNFQIPMQQQLPYFNPQPNQIPATYYANGQPLVLNPFYSVPAGFHPGYMGKLSKRRARSVNFLESSEDEDEYYDHSDYAESDEYFEHSSEFIAYPEQTYFNYDSHINNNPSGDFLNTLDSHYDHFDEDDSIYNDIDLDDDDLWGDETLELFDYLFFKAFDLESESDEVFYTTDELSHKSAHHESPSGYGHHMNAKSYYSHPNGSPSAKELKAESKYKSPKENDKKGITRKKSNKMLKGDGKKKASKRPKTIAGNKPKEVFQIHSPNKNLNIKELDQLLKSWGYDTTNAEIQIINPDDKDNSMKSSPPSGGNDNNNRFKPPPSHTYPRPLTTTTTTRPLISTTKKVYRPHKDTERHTEESPASYVYEGSHNHIFPGLYSHEKY